MEATEILELIDSCQGVLPFLANDGRMHLADARLTVFRSPQDWAIFVEVPLYSYGEAAFYTWAGGVGNCLIDDDCISYGTRNSYHLFEEVADAPLWEYSGTIRHRWIGDRAKFSIRFEGERSDFTPSGAEYAAAGIVFKDQRTGPDSIEPGCFLRFLCHHLGHPFFAAESELRSVLHDSPDLEIFIQTRHWHHPAFLIDGIGETNDPWFEADMIRNIPGFQILARAIASGDLTEWNSQNRETFNTHWESLEAIRKGDYGLDENWI